MAAQESVLRVLFEQIQKVTDAIDTSRVDLGTNLIDDLIWGLSGGGEAWLHVACSWCSLHSMVGSELFVVKFTSLRVLCEV